MPRPKLHLIRFHGVLAPNAKLRSRVVPEGPPKDEEAPGVAACGVQCVAQTAQVWPVRISWARLLKRVFDIALQHCPNFGSGELKIIAALMERPVIERILSHLGLAPQPPAQGQGARGAARIRRLSGAGRRKHCPNSSRACCDPRSGSCDRKRGLRTGQTVLSQSMNIDLADILTRAFRGACSAWSRATCWMTLDSMPRRAKAMRASAALETAVGE